MKRATKNVYLAFSALLLLVTTVRAWADESDVYESVAEIDIGRVFLTPSERDRLDLQRLRPEVDSSLPLAKSDDARPVRRRKKPAGYILSSRGSRQEWSGNEFVEFSNAAPRPSEFPGDVKVKRHHLPVAENETDGSEDD